MPTPTLAAAALLILLAVTASCQLLVDLDGLEDRHCGPDDKWCPGGCVSRRDPATGCGLAQCSPCAPPNATAKCSTNYECMIESCVDPWKDCNGTYGDGCEIDLAHNPENCETCGRVCMKPKNGIAGCSEKQCTIGGCNPGHEDCDGDYLNGCEHDIWTDLECIGCGIPCPDGTHCDQGVCVEGPRTPLDASASD